MAYTYN